MLVYICFAILYCTMLYYIQLNESVSYLNLQPRVYDIGCLVCNSMFILVTMRQCRHTHQIHTALLRQHDLQLATNNTTHLIISYWTTIYITLAKHFVMTCVTIATLHRTPSTTSSIQCKHDWHLYGDSELVHNRLHMINTGIISK